MELVSIIMPNYNSGLYIAESIESVINQTYENWELIICDDNSDDESKKIAYDYSAKDSRISLISNIYQKGAPGARNSCLDISKGRYIAFLDSDDLWLENKLEIQISFMSKNGYDFIFSYNHVISESGEFICEYKAPKSVNLKLMRFSNFIPCLTAIYDSKSIGKVYQPHILKRNDFALWLKILNYNKVTSAYCLPISTSKYRSNNYGLSANKIHALKYYYKCLIDYGGCGIFKSLLHSFAYLIIMVFKKKFVYLYNKLVIIL
jgi:teichuronic acid biosynthesis glycosyltransferase TuaG